MGKAWLVFPLLFLLLAAQSGLAECITARPSAGELFFSFGPEPAAASADMTAYLERSPSDPCIVNAKAGQLASGLVTVTPSSVAHNGASYGLYSFRVSVSKTRYTPNGTKTSIIFQEDGGRELFRVNVTILVGEKEIRPLNVTVAGCEDPDAAGCEGPKYFIPTPQPGIIEKNWPQIVTTVFIVGGFLAIIAIFYYGIRGRD